jgi:hypothetical protein
MLAKRMGDLPQSPPGPSKPFLWPLTPIEEAARFATSLMINRKPKDHPPN